MKKIIKILTTIFLAVISSALWEKLLSPYFDVLMNYILSFGNKFITYISNMIYTRISEGVYINIPYYLFIILISSVIGMCIMQTYTIYFNEKGKNIDTKNKKHCLNRDDCKIKKILGMAKCKCAIYLSCTLIFIFLYFFFLLMTNFINNTITTVTNNIEIVSPYIEDKEYKTLNSKFHSMNTRADYDEIINILIQYQEDYNIDIK